MIAVLLSTLFAASAVLAAATIAAAWRRHGPAALALRGELAACEQWREVRTRISEVMVRQNAVVLRPAFTRRSERPSPVSALSAAA